MTIWGVIGWVVVGFAIGAVMLYGPVMAKAILLNRRSAQAFQAAVARNDEFKELQEQLLARGNEYSALQKDHNRLLEQHLKAQKEYGEALKELVALKRAASQPHE